MTPERRQDGRDGGNGWTWEFPFRLGSFTGAGAQAVALLVILVLTLALGGLLGIVYAGFQSSTAALEAQTRQIQMMAVERRTQFAALQQADAQTDGTLQALVYVFLLEPRDRAALLQRMRRPVGLDAMLRDSEGAGRGR